VTTGIAADVQRSLRHGRLETARRLLERERRAALALLGERASALAAAGVLPATALAGALERVASCRHQIEEKGSAISALGG
jgi:uncharacterized protein YbjQ (UPF0145 family)